MARYSLKIKPYPLKWAPGRYWGCFRCLSESLVDRNCGAILLILALKGSFLAPKPHMWRYSEKSCAILTHLANHLNSLKPNFQQIRAGRGRSARDGTERLGTEQSGSGRGRSARDGAERLGVERGQCAAARGGAAHLSSAQLSSTLLGSILLSSARSIKERVKKYRATFLRFGAKKCHMAPKIEVWRQNGQNCANYFAHNRPRKLKRRDFGSIAPNSASETLSKILNRLNS